MDVLGFAVWRQGLERGALGAGLAAALVLAVPAALQARDSADAGAEAAMGVAAQSGSYLAGRFAQHVDDWKAAAQ